MGGGRYIVVLHVVLVGVQEVMRLGVWLLVYRELGKQRLRVG